MQAVGLGVALALALLAVPQGARADLWRAEQAQLTEAAPLAQSVLDLSAALNMAEVMAVLREEGIAGSADLAEDLPNGLRDPVWAGAVLQIYDVAQMEAVFNRAFAAQLEAEPEAVAAATAFFRSEIGQRVLGLELAARRALMDEAVEAAAAEAHRDLAVQNPKRQALLDRFVAANDLVESNVMGALNANLAFLRGLAEGGGEDFVLPEADMLAQVWSAEPEVRAEMTDWLFPFLTLAYQPLSDAELTAYVEFSETPAGQRVNAAMFQAFDAVFNGISRDLGRAYGQALQGNDI
ncbi:DUF2059 domain-containing protein [Tabrizicola sp.]|uniref:DUF2059 domain-containing protein n=1 Tax=Tabrizicola sp. TaxID=2005166 RepID=UPI003D274598